MRILFLIILFFCMSNGYAQTNLPKDIDTTRIVDKAGKTQTFIYVEQMPEASYDVQAYIAEHINKTNCDTKDLATDKIVVNFIVKKDGSISSANVLNDLPKCWKIEVINIINHLPPWKPGYQHGVAVEVKYTLAIKI